MTQSRKHHRRSSKHRHHRRCGHSRSHRRVMKGGYSSASTYGEFVNQSGAAQFSRVFDQSGPYGQVPGNAIIGAQGQNAPNPAHMPTAANLKLIQNGGRKRGTKRGGFLGVVNQAIVPFGLVGLNHMYKRRSHSGRRYSGRRHSGRRHSRRIH